jgi:predicted RNA-binding Zn ribbon-like protein
MTLPAWVPAPEQKPAPAPLRLVQAFVNTRDLDLGTDLLVDPGQANQWLHGSGLLAPRHGAGPEDLGTARVARESIRALLARNGGGPPPAAADLRPLEAVTGQSGLRLAVGPEGRVQLDPQPPGSLAAGLASLLLIIRDAQQDGTWARLKACRNDDCRWAFYDRSHTRQGAWCDMAVCGNLIKNRNLRARRGRARARLG